MVDPEYVESQLKAIKFHLTRVNRPEINELQNILHPDEKIYECVNGFYEGGVALLVATDIRVLLIDKKPMGFLNVDDLRFDMISDIDYNHRAFGAQIRINCGMKNLTFKSYNQPKLRKLISNVQQRMSEIKREMVNHEAGQNQHLEEINKQLQMYLLAQQQQLERQVNQNQAVNLPKPSPQLADYLFAQRLLEEFHNNGSKITNDSTLPESDQAAKVESMTSTTPEEPTIKSQQELIKEMTEAGRMEVFGGADKISHQAVTDTEVNNSAIGAMNYQGADITPFKIASAKLPYLLKSRRYTRPFYTNFVSRSSP